VTISHDFSFMGFAVRFFLSSFMLRSFLGSQPSRPLLQKLTSQVDGYSIMKRPRIRSRIGSNDKDQCLKLLPKTESSMRCPSIDLILLSTSQGVFLSQALPDKSCHYIWYTGRPRFLGKSEVSYLQRRKPKRGCFLFFEPQIHLVRFPGT
jgi:hypothetical protein